MKDFSNNPNKKSNFRRDGLKFNKQSDKNRKLKDSNIKGQQKSNIGDFKKSSKPFLDKSKRFDKPKKDNFLVKKTLENSKQEQKPGNELIRLNKFIANSGVCSRRKADELIASGHITVNDIVVRDLGYKIKPTDVVKYNGQVLTGEKKVYIVLNKPKDYITSVSDPYGRKTVMEFFKNKVKERIFPVGRLDRNTTGVLLFTNDGDLAKRLTHPSSRVSKIYSVVLDHEILPDEMKKLAEGVELEDGFMNVDSIFYFSESQKDRVIVEIHSGRNRIIRRLFEHIGFGVKKLDRLEFGGISKRDLKRGEWRFLTEKEIGWLKMIAGQVRVNANEDFSNDLME